MCVCVHTSTWRLVHARGLLIGLIRQSCCTAPERIILRLFSVCFTLMFSKRYDLYLEQPPPTPLTLAPITSPVLQSSFHASWTTSCRSSELVALFFPLWDKCRSPDLSLSPPCHRRSSASLTSSASHSLPPTLTRPCPCLCIVSLFSLPALLPLWV